MTIWQERLQRWKNQVRENILNLRAKSAPFVKKIANKVSGFAKKIPVSEKLKKFFQRVALDAQRTSKKVLEKILPKDSQKSLANGLDWRGMLEWTSNTLQKRGASFYGMLLASTVSAYFLSDVTALWIESKLPELQTTDSTKAGFSGQPKQLTEDDIAAIWTRNLFSSKNLIPGESTSGGGPGGDLIDHGGVPQPTSLPLNLVGTLILRDELRSIATIEDKSSALVYPVRIEDEIPTKIRILKIEPNRVTFLNISSGRREFVEIPVDQAANRVTLGRQAGTGAGVQIERVGNNFNVPRNDLDRAFSDLNTVLTQARAVPHYENGVPAGYKLFQVMPEGFFGKLGLKDQDIICGIDGQPVNDPSKALELLGQLKTANHIELCVKRDGRQQNFAYDIR